MVNVMDKIYKDADKLFVNNDYYDDSVQWELRNMLEKHAKIANMGEM